MAYKLPREVIEEIERLAINNTYAQIAEKLKINPITAFEVDLNAKNKEIYNLMSELKDKNSTLDQLNIKFDINEKKLDEVNMNIEKFNQLGFWGKGKFKF